MRHTESFHSQNWVRHGVVFLVIAGFGWISESCSQPECKPEVQQCTCPQPKPCPIPGQIQLSQLDAQARKRLKDEAIAEIREETKAQWRRELEAEFVGNCPKEEVKTEKSDAEETDAKPPVQEETAPDKSKKKSLSDRIKPLPPTQKIERDNGGLKILRHTFATQIDHRQPVDEREIFSIGDSSVFCFVEIASSEEFERNITIRFIHSTGLSQSYNLPVGQSPAWRTWSKLNLTKSMTGSWLCEVYNEDGALLASRSFAIVDEL